MSRDGLLRGALLSVLVILAGAPPETRAGEADVVAVEAIEEDDGLWTFSVTVRHADRNPDHWADWWRVRTPAGEVLGRRVLLHSHVDEQPFTRSGRIRVPGDVRIVVVEAHDKVHGLGGATVTVDLSMASGPGYRVRPQR